MKRPWMGWGVGLSIVLVGCGGSVVENAPAEDAALDKAQLKRLAVAAPVRTLI